MGKKPKNNYKVITSFLLVLSLFLTSGFVTGLFAKNDNTQNIIFSTYTFSFEEPKFSEVELTGKTFTRISVSNCISHGSPGQPSLPISTVKILVPQGMVIMDIIVVEGKCLEVNYDLSSKPVVPQQDPIILRSHAKNPTLKMDEEIYKSLNPVLNKYFDNFDVNFCRGYKILSLDLHPVKYIPGNNRILYHPEMTVKLKLKQIYEANQFFRNNSDDENWIKNLVFNGEETDSYDPSSQVVLEYTDGLCDPGDSYDYVIITTTQNGLDDWATSGGTPNNWTSLMNKHQTDDGLSCTLVTMEDIIACSDYWNTTALFNDTPAKIREFCKDAYQDWGTSYVLIGGDDDLIPAREMDYAYESDVDTDIYWSNLDNSFNADEDSLWGEASDVGFDLYSELYIGRLTCDVPQDVSNWMNKSFTYADSTSEDYLENAGFYGGDSGWLTEGDDFIDFSAIQGTSDWLGPDPGSIGEYPDRLGFLYGFETWNNEHPNIQFNLSVKWTAEPTNTGWQGGSAASAQAGLKNAINNDDVTLLSGLAHANADVSLDISSSTWESNYHNTMPFFIYDYGCHCGDMDAADDGVLHSMLFHSDTELAFACIYNTCYGWGAWDDTNASSSLHQKLFWDYIFDLDNNSGSASNWQLGKAMAFSRDVMAPTVNWTYGGAPGAWRATIQGCLLFGDPAQKLKAPGNASNITLDEITPANGSADISVGSVTLSVNVTDYEGDTMDIIFRTNESGTWHDIGSNSSQASGAYYQIHSFDSYNTKYWWSVNATDLTGTSGWTNETYHFTTIAMHNVTKPTNFQAITHNRSQINLSWIRGENATHTYIERNTSLNWEKANGTLIYNNTGTSYNDINLDMNTLYYYRAWSWDNDQQILNTSSIMIFNTTNSNNLPVLSSESPSNRSISLILNSSLYVTVSDSDLDLMNVTFLINVSSSWTLIGYNDSSSDGTYVQTCSSFDTYETTYWWSVNCSDGYNWTNETYSFTITSNEPPALSNGNPSNEYTNVSLLTSSLSVDINDLDGDPLNWTIETSPNIGSQDNSTGAEGNGTKTCVITSLRHSTTYYWYVNVSDGKIWTNETYSFTTNYAPSHSSETPTNNSNTISPIPVLSITCSDTDSDVMTAFWHSNSSGSWDVFAINNSINDGSSITQVNNNFSGNGTKYWWSVNLTDENTWVNSTYHFTTNYAPSISSPSPSNGSTGVTVSTTIISVTINDIEGDTFNWTIETSPNVGYNTGENSSNGSISCNISSLSYSTTYYWFVNVTNGRIWTNNTYNFQTEAEQTDDPGGGGGGGGSPAPPLIINNAPSIPVVPIGSTEGYVNETYTYSTNSSDSDSDQICYKFDWGDGTTSDWTDLTNTGVGILLSHNWSANGKYTVKAISKDEHNFESDWSDSLNVTIKEKTSALDDSAEDNELTVEMLTTNTVNESVNFSASVARAGEETLTYFWDFGDGTKSLEKQSNHTYAEPGTYDVTFVVYDEDGKLVNMTTFTVTIQSESSVSSDELVENNQQLETSFIIILAIFFGGLVVVILLLLKRITKAAIPDKSSEYSYDKKISAKKLQTHQARVKLYKLKPKRAPATMADVEYDHDIVMPNIDYPPDIRDIEFEISEFKQLQKSLKDIRKEIDKILARYEEKKK